MAIKEPLFGVYSLYKCEKSPRRHLIITAHGAKTEFIKKLPQEGPKLLMYSPDKSVLKDPGLENVVNGKVTHLWAIHDGADYNDYRLTRYDPDQATAEQVVDSQAHSKTEDAILGEWDSPLAYERCDVLCVDGENDVYLSNLLMYQKIKSYLFIHCIFCTDVDGALANFGSTAHTSSKFPVEESLPKPASWPKALFEKHKTKKHNTGKF